MTGPRGWNSTLPARTVPLARGVSLARHTGLGNRAAAKRNGRTVPLRATRPASPSAFSQETREAIRRRAGSRCEACAVYLPPRCGHMQHRVARGMGGSRNPVLGSAANGVLLCPPCHAVAESRDAASYERGFWRWSTEDPLEVPVMVHGRTLRWLTLDGEYSTEPPQGRAA